MVLFLLFGTLSVDIKMSSQLIKIIKDSICASLVGSQEIKLCQLVYISNIYNTVLFLQAALSLRPSEKLVQTQTSPPRGQHFVKEISSHFFLQLCPRILISLPLMLMPEDKEGKGRKEEGRGETGRQGREGKGGGGVGNVNGISRSNSKYLH